MFPSYITNHPVFASLCLGITGVLISIGIWIDTETISEKINADSKSHENILPHQSIVFKYSKSSEGDKKMEVIIPLSTPEEERYSIIKDCMKIISPYKEAHSRPSWTAKETKDE